LRKRATGEAFPKRSRASPSMRRPEAREQPSPCYRRKKEHRLTGLGATTVIDHTTGDHESSRPTCPVVFQVDRLADHLEYFWRPAEIGVGAAARTRKSTLARKRTCTSHDQLATSVDSFVWLALHLREEHPPGH
jgi:hypothetical protein